MAKGDVIVVGGGLAGASAALRLGSAGFQVTLLEARDRAGGRAYLKPFPHDDEPQLEYGGSWITPWHHRIRAHVEALGLALRPKSATTSRFWFYDGALHSDGPIPPEQRAAHERAIARTAIDAMLVKKGIAADEHGRPFQGVSFKDYLDRINAPPATRELYGAWWVVTGNGLHERTAATEFLGSCAYYDGLAELISDSWAETVVPGMQVLAERMIAKSGAEVRFDAAVSSVTQSSSRVNVETASGERFAADWVILALGVNQLGAMVFAPPLPPPKQQAVKRGHEGRAFKIWAKLKGVPVGTLVTGGGSGVEFAFAERKTRDDATLVIGFGLQTNFADPGDPQWVKSQMARFFPNAQLIAHDWHDWITDSHARGTWVSVPAGFEAGLDNANWQMEGRVAFASSDIARDQAGWFEGAVIAGEDAADAIIDRSTHIE
jgi:monoamine oxidase